MTQKIGKYINFCTESFAWTKFGSPEKSSAFFKFAFGSTLKNAGGDWTQLCEKLNLAPMWGFVSIKHEANHPARWTRSQQACWTKCNAWNWNLNTTSITELNQFEASNFMKIADLWKYKRKIIINKTFLICFLFWCFHSLD